MSVKIGHASIDENRKAKGGAAGDQTKKEVYTRAWYSYPWTSVIRPKNSTVAEKIAKAMEQACANDKIGYDQNQRTTLYTQAKAKNWDLSKITTACECDCSSLVAVCVNAAGIAVSKDIYTGNEKAALNATGKFDIYTSSQYIAKDSYLKRGDILLGSGHTAIVLSNGDKVVVQNLTATQKPVATQATTTTGLKVGDAIKLVAGAKYTSGKNVPSWVTKKTVYVREIRDDGNIVVSVLKIGAITGVVNSKYIIKNGQTVSTATSTSTSNTTKLNVGDAVKLISGAKYTSGKSIPSWVFNCTLYVRELRGSDSVVISTLKSGAITGVVSKKYLTKV